MNYLLVWPFLFLRCVEIYDIALCAFDRAIHHFLVVRHINSTNVLLDNQPALFLDLHVKLVDFLFTEMAVSNIKPVALHDYKQTFKVARKSAKCLKPFCIREISLDCIYYLRTGNE